MKRTRDLDSDKYLLTDVRPPEGDGMKRFVTELTGKTVMTADGRILGVIENLVVDTRSGHVQDVLVAPAEDVDGRAFRIDPQGRLMLPFQGLKAIRDVVVMDSG